MRIDVLSVIAMAALLASGGVALAKGPTKLADSQLDKITAGDRGGWDSADRGFEGRGFGDRGFSDRGVSHRWSGDRGFGDRGFGDRGFGDRGIPGRGVSVFEFRGPIR
jgi:cold shock protein